MHAARNAATVISEFLGKTSEKDFQIRDFSSGRAARRVHETRNPQVTPDLPPENAVGLRPAVKRRLVTLAAGASLLLCIATVALWVRSFWRADAVAYVSHDSMASSLVVRNAWGIFSNIGELSLMAGAQVGPRNDEDKGGWQLTTREADPSETLRSFARNFFPNSTSGSFVGFGFLFIDNRGFEFRGVSLPHWFVALATAVAPAIRARGVLRARRAHRGDMCPACGYDLRATPDRCPECGGVPASAVGFVPP